MLTTLLLCAVSAAPLAMSSQSGMSVHINTYITQRRHRGSGRPRGGGQNNEVRSRLFLRGKAKIKCCVMERPMSKQAGK